MAGNYLTSVIPIHYVQIAAAASFILFGLWTIRGDELKDEDQKFHFNPFWTVAIAFFLAEMGDKTQLATVSLAAKYQSIIPVLIGTTTGMLIADAIGIGIGIVLGKRIPERAVKWIAALTFIFFGLYGLCERFPKESTSLPIIISVLVLTLLAIIIVGRKEILRCEL